LERELAVLGILGGTGGRRRRARVDRDGLRRRRGGALVGACACEERGEAEGAHRREHRSDGGGPQARDKSRRLGEGARLGVKAPTLASHMKTLRAAALAYPGAVEEFPWGDRVFKVRKKIFVFINVHEGKLYVTAKLPASGKMALLLPFASPTGYNLGKSGWV